MTQRSGLPPRVRINIFLHRFNYFSPYYSASQKATARCRPRAAFSQKTTAIFVFVEPKQLDNSNNSLEN